jgi:hypothetical protein
MDEEKIKAEVNGKTVPKRHFGNHNAKPKQKGSITKNTKITREILANALAGQEVNVKDALEKLAQKNPEAYINAIAKLLNYAMPKLQSTEITAQSSKKIEINLDNNISIDDLKAKMEALEREDDIEDIEFEDLDG